VNSQVAADTVRRCFDFLAEKGELEIILPLKEADHAAGWVIDVVSLPFSVRLTLDRGQVFVELGAGPAATNWHDMGIVISFLTKGERSFEYYIPEGPISDEEVARQIARGADVARDNFAMLVDFFLPDGFEVRESELVAYRKTMSEAHWKRLLR